MRKYLLAVALVVVGMTSCDKDRDLQKAVVVDTRDIASGGCGFVLQLTDDGSMVMPLYLDSKYQHNGYKVKVKYDTNNEGKFCKGGYPDTSRFYTEVQIREIKADMD